VGAGQLLAVIGVLANPCYAGAIAFGRTRKAGRAGGQGPACGRRPVPIPQWEGLITGHHPRYISWEEYLANQDRGPAQWYLIIDGAAAGSGYGRPVDAGEAGRIAQAFRLPPRFDQVRTAGFDDDAGFCDDCGVSYCARHWHVSQTGYGTCPLGHGKSLDPHWQPAEDDCAMLGDDDQQQLSSAAPDYPERDDMDAANYEDLAGRLYGLLIGLGDRLKGE
jgi:hypothetical protein